MSFLKKIIVFILTLESRLIIKRYKPFIIAITGSVGKTATKDAVYAVLKKSNDFVRKSEKSLNSEIGLPLTIIGAPNAWYNAIGWFNNIIHGLELIIRRTDYPNLLILEVGADHPGDIKKIVKWLRPDIAVITKISQTPVHVEFFNSPEQVFEEKAELARAVKKGGTLILFADDEKTVSLGRIINASRTIKGPENELKTQPLIAGLGNNDDINSKGQLKQPSVMTFGTVESASIKGFDYIINGINEGFSFKINFNGRIETIKINGVLGKQQMYPLLAAVAVGKARGLSTDDIMRGLYDYEPPKGRMNVLVGINDSTIVDDSYNSSPDAVLLALEALGEAKCAGRRIAVLGDMMELGKYSGEEHRKIGREVGKVANVLITVGPRSRATAEEALKNGMPAESVKSFDNSLDAVPYVVSITQPGDVILIKGSQSPRLERVTKALLREPEKAGQLLVRQETQWLEKE